MSQLHVTLELPDDVSERVRRTARGMKKPVEQALVSIVRAALPSLEKVPTEFREQLQSLEEVSDDELRQVAQGCLAPTKQRRLTNLLAKNQTGALTERERLVLLKLRSEADAVTLHRAYAGLLLKYRGQPMLTGTELKR